MLTPSSYPQYVFGADSSSWEDIPSTPQVPDFILANQLGWKFNYLRASFGSYYIDKSFRRDWANCRKTPMLLGAYHFLVWEQSPELQADFFWNIVKDDPGELPLICDFEWWSTIPSNAFDLLYRFLERLKKNSNNKKSGIYTAYYFWKQYGKIDSYWKQYILWLAHYDDTSPVSAKQIPLPWEKCDFWQFTGHGPGEYYGMESKDVDLNFYMGSWSDLLNLCDLQDIPDPNNPPDNNGDDSLMLKLQVQVDTLNVRSGPSTSNPVQRQIHKGDIVTVYDVAGKDSSWVKVSDVANEWSCVQNVGNLFLKKV